MSFICVFLARLFYQMIEIPARFLQIDHAAFAAETKDVFNDVASGEAQPVRIYEIERLDAAGGDVVRRAGFFVPKNNGRLMFV